MKGPAGRKPKVSVCVPTYNYAGYLPACIESVLAQSFGDFELVVIDDCSTDGTREVLDRYRGDGRVRILANAANLGMVGNWNRCLAEAQGAYVKFVFGDDLLSSGDALKRMVEVLDSRPSVTLVSSARTLVDSESRVLRTLSHFRSATEMGGVDAINLCLYLQKNIIGEPSVVMFRRGHSARGFHPGYRQIVDLEMWFHLLEQGRLYYIDEPLSCFRVHPCQQTAMNRNSLLCLEDTRNLLRDYLDKPYVRLGRIFRLYLRYDQVYQAWKLYRKKRAISREDALRKISEQTDLLRFFGLLPFYKTYRPLMRARRYLFAPCTY